MRNRDFTVVQVAQKRDLETTDSDVMMEVVAIFVGQVQEQRLFRAKTVELRAVKIMDKWSIDVTVKGSAK